MKKLVSIIMLAACVSLVSAKAKKEEAKEEPVKTEESSGSSEWKEVGKQGKKALTETGHFFRDLGKQIGSDAKEAAKEVKKSVKETSDKEKDSE